MWIFFLILAARKDHVFTISSEFCDFWQNNNVFIQNNHALKNIIHEESIYFDNQLRNFAYKLSFMLHQPGLTFQQDNSHPNTAHISTACLSSCWTLPWPARSPDLSSIEHIWSIMGRALQPDPDVDDLMCQLDRIWHDIPQEDIHNLYQSMPSQSMLA